MGRRATTCTRIAFVAIASTVTFIPLTGDAEIIHSSWLKNLRLPFLAHLFDAQERPGSKASLPLALDLDAPEPPVTLSQPRFTRMAVATAERAERPAAAPIVLAALEMPSAPEAAPAGAKASFAAQTGAGLPAGRSPGTASAAFTPAPASPPQTAGLAQIGDPNEGPAVPASEPAIDCSDPAVARTQCFVFQDAAPTEAPAPLEAASPAPFEAAKPLVPELPQIETAESDGLLPPTENLGEAPPAFTPAEPEPELLANLPNQITEPEAEPVLAQEVAQAVPAPGGAALFGLAVTLLGVARVRRQVGGRRPH